MSLLHLQRRLPGNGAGPVRRPEQGEVDRGRPGQAAVALQQAVNGGGSMSDFWTNVELVAENERLRKKVADLKAWRQSALETERRRKDLGPVIKDEPEAV